MKNFDESAPDFPEPDREQRSKAHVPRRVLLAAFILAATALILGVSGWILFHKARDRPELDLDPHFVVETTPRTRTYHWTVTKINASPVGVNKSMVVVNGKSPGPLIEANYHDRIIVHVKNGLVNAGTSIHWHGLYQNGTNYYDGTAGITQCDIPIGETLVYNFTLDGWSGTTWWHGHTGTQHTDGLFGPIVIHKPNETVPHYEEDRVLVLSDVYNTWSSDLLSEYLNSNPMETIAEPVPDAATINGVGQFTACDAFPDSFCDGGSYYNLTLKPNKTYRLRLINAGSFAPIRFSVDRHVLTVIEADGTPVVPIEVESVMLQAAQRYSVLLTTNQTPSAYWMRATIDDGMFAYINHHMNPETLGMVRYTTDSTAMPAADSRPGTERGTAAQDLNVHELVPADAVDAPSDISLAIPFTFSIQRTYLQNWRSFVNGTSWEILPHGQSTLVSSTARDASLGTRSLCSDQLIASVDGVKVLDFVINNLDDGDHPFHLHGYKPWIMGAGRGRYVGTYLNMTNPMRRDTFFVPRFTWMVIRIVTDTPGYWAFHCHIAWHMAAGGFFQLAVQPNMMADVTLPNDIVSQCQSWLS
ncbi:multi-copper oxidase [Mucidula mucida]|nr:multi-copper oxidase [Mucidula mucida]